MTGAAPWSVKGIDPKAREIAKDLARRSGMTLGDWLNQMILEDAPAAESAPAEPEPAPDDAARVAVALERLTSRIESAEHRSTLAISGIDQSVVGLLSRLEGSERQQVAVAARFEGVIEEIQSEQARVAERHSRTACEVLGDFTRLGIDPLHAPRHSPCHPNRTPGCQERLFTDSWGVNADLIPNLVCGALSCGCRAQRDPLPRRPGADCLHM